MSREEARISTTHATIKNNANPDATRNFATSGGRMQEQAVFGYFFPRKKVTRRKGHPFQDLCVNVGFHHVGQQCRVRSAPGSLKPDQISKTLKGMAVRAEGASSATTSNG
ncbi:hypothetical protein J2W83_002498 [Pseudomonas hunanensis]|uniref:Uncharacterized protein n=1 Tax=Pseudomonas hunanensis TaxID=1247546 RepID=A0ACC6K370_9PSED|nr:hypothetical protein [Pseudomonas hunanensis]MDR6712896.1 hypothetical protein [Pseudomonas hunanensis]